MAEGAVSGLITGAAVDGAIALTVATGGTERLVAGAIVGGAIGGATGGIAGDVAGQVVSQRSEESIKISTDNFTSKAVTGGVTELLVVLQVVR